jgi:hypothetical protein
LSQISQKILPCRDKSLHITISEAVNRFNYGVTEKANLIRWNSNPFDSLLILIKAFNPDYFLGAVIHAKDGIYTNIQSDVIMHYGTQDVPLLEIVHQVNLSNIPLEYGGPKNSSVPRAKLMRHRLQQIRTNT